MVPVKATSTARSWGTVPLWLLVASTLFYVVHRAFTGAGARRIDTYPLYLGGRCWLEGLSPYVTATFHDAWARVYQSVRPESMVFAYPPTIAAWLIPLGTMSPQSAFLVWDLLNVAALLVVGASLAVALSARASLSFIHWRIAAGLMLAFATGAISGNLQTGQTAILVLAPLVALWCIPNGAWHWVAALLILAATIKPSLSLPFLAYFLVTRPRATTLAVVLSAPLVLFVASRSGGILAMPQQWLQALGEYGRHETNAPTSMASGVALVATLTGAKALTSLVLVAVGFGFYLGFRDRRAPEPLRSRPPLSSLVGLSAAVLAFAPLHAYDLVLVMPVAAVLPFIELPHAIALGMPALLLMRPNAFISLVGAANANLLTAGAAWAMVLYATFVFLPASKATGEPAKERRRRWFGAGWIPDLRGK